MFAYFIRLEADLNLLVEQIKSIIRPTNLM